MTIGRYLYSRKYRLLTLQKGADSTLAKKKKQDFFGSFDEQPANPNAVIEAANLFNPSSAAQEEPTIGDDGPIFEYGTGKKKKAKKAAKSAKESAQKPKKKKAESNIDAPKKEKSKPSKKKEKKDSSKNQKKIATLKSTQIFSPIREVRDGIIITKSGDFIKLLEFSSINFMLRSEYEKDNIISEYASVIKILPDNVQFKVISRKADTTHYVEKIREDHETEPNAHCRQLQREQIQMIRFMGSRQAITRRFLLAFRFENTDTTKHLDWDDIKDSLNTTASRITSAMKRLGNELVSKATDDYTLEMLYGIMCRNQAENMSFKDRLRATIIRYMVDSGAELAPRYVPVNDLICPQYIDTKNHKYIVVDGIYYTFAYLPSSSYPSTAVAGWLALFSNLGEGIDVDLYLKKVETSAVRVKLQYAIKANKISLKTTEDTSLDYEEKVSTVNSGYYLKNGLASGDDFCYMNILLTITGRSPEELESRYSEIKEFCASIDIAIKRANYQHEQGFLSALPLCDLDKNLFGKSKRNILGSDFSSTYPFSSFEVSDENGIFLGINESNNSMVFIDNFDAKKYVNPNMVFLGTSGAGKTYTLQCVALRMRQRKIQTFIIAPIKGHEFKRACDTIGGSYVKISTGSKQNINIMEIRKIAPHQPDPYLLLLDDSGYHL